jgi:hypothetical protein
MDQLKGLQDKFKKAIPSLLQTITAEESQLSKLELEDLEKQEKASRIYSFLQDVGERKRYANKIFTVVVVWLFLILVILLLVGFGLMILSDAVLIALISSTTANVTIFLVIVAKYLFPSIGK